MKSIREEARKFLVNQKDVHSKSKGLAKNLKLQPYLQSKNLSLAEKQLLFKLRTFTYDCKSNFRNKFASNLNCSVCNSEDTQQHLLACSIASDIDTENVEHDDIFGTVDKQIRIVRVLKIIDQRRSLHKKESSSNGSQAHLL